MDKTPTDAKAPYNFVPLPKKVYSVEQGISNGESLILPWKAHDQFLDHTNSGWIELDITTLTPLFIRGSSDDSRETRLFPEPFKSIDGKPVIPGSSLRGMVRALVEILSFSKITNVTNEKPFFRTVAPDRIGDAYRKLMIKNNQKPSGGYVEQRGREWVIVPAKETLRASHNVLQKIGMKIPKSADEYPSWKGQHKQCWFKRDHKDKISDISLSSKEKWEVGTLVFTGYVPKKKAEFVFVGKQDTCIKIPEDIWRRFHSEDQITQWQEKAFPRDEPNKNCRKAAGHIRKGEPIFYVIDEKCKENGLVFFGRAQMFRFPYDLSPQDLIPSNIRNAGLDLAEAIFGRVGRTKTENTIKGRVFFENAVATTDAEFFEKTIVPKILSSPKVTCFQHYLFQESKDKRYHKTYLKEDLHSTCIRGSKLYWHRWSEKGLDEVKEEVGQDRLLQDLSSNDPKDSQHTIMTPIKEGICLKGRIQFRNLTDIELGTLLSALKLPEGCAHKIGMAKPLGLGSIRIEPKLFLVNRVERYSCWQQSGVTEANPDRFLRSFESTIEKHAEKCEEVLDTSKSGLRKICRLDALFHMLSWDRRPEHNKTAYMGLSEFKNRPVLPFPHSVMNLAEPKSKIIPLSKQKSISFNTPQYRPPQPSPKPIEARQIYKAPPANTTAKPTAAKPIETGQTRNGMLKKSDSGWVGIFDNDHREAVITNQNSLPKNIKDGDKAEFYIVEQNKRKGIKVRFEKLL